MKSTESKTSQILKSVEKALFPVLDKENNNILLAFSAGADSTVLLDVLFRLKDKLKITTTAAYFNHCLRKKDEIEKEINIAKNNCYIRNILFFTGEDNEGIIDKFSRRDGIEAAARRARYCFLNDLAQKNNCKYIAVAHNLEDNCETIIMRFFQGSGPEGLKGIGEKYGNIIRPLINVKKSDIFEYLEENKIEFSHDSTNAENDYLRNKIRKDLIPAIKKVFPGYEKALFSLAGKMTNADSIIDEKLSEKIEWEKKGSALVTEYDKFASLPEYLKIKAIYSAFNITEDSGERLPYKFLKPLFSKKSGKKSHIILKGHNYTLEREGKSLFWKRDIENIKKNSYYFKIEPEKEYELPVISDGNNKKIYIYSEVVKKAECAKNDLWIPVEKLTFDIYIRNRNEGDFIVFGYGKKSIKKLFLEMEIERYFRDLIPIICNNEEILAVWGSVFNYSNRVSKLILDTDNNNNIDVLLFKSKFS
ncbi:MAG: tRNA lysidine(34) synthetase TilS [Spirochaetaceae bacterium]|nr:tRNA lysidine(34) synthetase TilS [Spirochaetaceae bacterium]